jgi:hypothetical protein
MKVRDDIAGSTRSDPQCPPQWRRKAGSGLLATLVSPVLVSMLATGATTPLTATGSHTVNVPTRLLATYDLAPTEEQGFSVIHGDALVALLKPYVDAATDGQTPPPDPGFEVVYPADLSKTSIAAGVANLQAAVGSDPKPVLTGISQGAVVISVYKQAFNEQYADAAPGTVIPTPTFVLVGNPSRPNGGLSERLAGLGISALGGTKAETISTPTETAGAAEGEVTTYDYARQYDFFADFPDRPLNAFAMTNAVFGAILAHGSYGPLDSSNGLVGVIMSHNPYGTVGPEDAIFQDQVGDTAYYLIPSEVLPMLQPLAFIGVPQPIILALDAPLRVLVEAGYDRTISPGTPTGINLAPVAHPVQTAINFAIAIPTGIDDGLEYAGYGRPLGTTPAGPYGVGGPPVTLTDSPDTESSATAELTADSSAASTSVSSSAKDSTPLLRTLGLPKLLNKTRTDTSSSTDTSTSSIEASTPALRDTIAKHQKSTDQSTDADTQTPRADRAFGARNNDHDGSRRTPAYRAHPKPGGGSDG